MEHKQVLTVRTVNGETLGHLLDDEAQIRHEYHILVDGFTLPDGKYPLSNFERAYLVANFIPKMPVPPMWSFSYLALKRDKEIVERT